MIIWGDKIIGFKNNPNLKFFSPTWEGKKSKTQEKGGEGEGKKGKKGKETGKEKGKEKRVGKEIGRKEDS